MSQTEPPVFDVVARIAQRLPALREAERKVAALILDDLCGSTRASIGELARRAGVSIATVTRFAKAVGCRDVRELKWRLASAGAVGERFLREMRGGAHGSLAARILDEIRATLVANVQLLDAAPVTQAVDVLLAARMIYVFGMGGGSTALADELRFRLVRLGRPVATYQDAALQRMVASTLSADTVVVALSATGQLPEIVVSCQIAREYGASVVAITAPASPLASIAQTVIPLIAQETEFIYKPSASRYAMMMALDVLVTELAVRQSDVSRELLRRAKYALDMHRGGSERQPLGD
ncbi:MurR/RpiR family transcriptional regulator [Mycetohabitans rhizoxinica]|uniref:MurR/RpiR family transcriptional regulator n=1 Tax=Mycetohabitans rhizoxinica TaxID=412963 RepID=UPI0030D566B6